MGHYDCKTCGDYFCTDLDCGKPKDKAEGLVPCTLCGALPCDWVENPHDAVTGLCWTMAKIREVMGVYEKPMMDELPGLLAKMLSDARLSGARDAISECEGIATRYWAMVSMPEDDHDDGWDDCAAGIVKEIRELDPANLRKEP